MIFNRTSILVFCWIIQQTVLNVDGFAAFMPRRSVLLQGGIAASSIGLAATGKEEDLELTRQIILNYINGGKDDEQKTVTQQQEQQQHEDVPEVASSTTTTSTKSSSWAGYLERPKNDNMIRVALGEVTSTTPVWLFRQAGRHLPEYHQYKGTKSFLDLLADPKDVAEVTLQPVRRYPLDAAILFSDILVIVEALNIPITMPGGVGIQVPEPLVSPDEIETRLSATTLTPDEAKTFVETRLGHVIEAVTLIRSRMVDENISIPLIGFSAAPWTLLYYMVGGSSKKNTDIGMEWLRTYPEASSKLLNLLTTIVTEYLACQIEAGAHMIQIFEAMGMMITDDLFEQYALPCLQQIGTELQNRYKEKGIPIMVFTRGACTDSNLQKVAAFGCFNVITIDGSCDRSSIRSVVGTDITIQGNYDPAELIVENGKTIETVHQSARDYLSTIGSAKLIANLGEGLGGKENPELVATFVNAIHDISTELLVVAKSSSAPTKSTTEPATV